MNCDYSEKLSAMIDGELPEPEIDVVRQHISGCSECGAVEKDYLFFREVMRTPVRVSEITTASTRLSFWKKGISIPVPAFAVLMLFFVGTVIGLLIWKSAIASTESKRNILSEQPPISTRLSSIVRFDHGGRAEIYVAKAGEK